MHFCFQSNQSNKINCTVVAIYLTLLSLGYFDLTIIFTETDTSQTSLKREDLISEAYKAAVIVAL